VVYNRMARSLDAIDTSRISSNMDRNIIIIWLWPSMPFLERLSMSECKHLVVKYVTTKDCDNFTVGGWRCVDCGMGFVPLADAKITAKKKITKFDNRKKHGILE